MKTAKKRVTRSEALFQSDLIKEIKNIFVGCIVTKLDPTHIQGIPDLLILYKDKWAALECKKSEKAKHRPNQEYYVQYIRDHGGFASFIHPENADVVLDEMSAFLLKE